VNARPKFYLDLADAADIAHTPWHLRDPEIDEARRLEAKEDARRERDEMSGDLMGAHDWEN
jgi:hypothetical protein